MFTFLLHTISRGCKTGSWTGDLKVQLPSSLAVASVYFFCVPWFHCKDMNVCQFTNITHETGQVNNYTRTISTPMKRYCIAEVYSNYATANQNILYFPFITKRTPNILTTCVNTIYRTSVDRWCVLQWLNPLFGSRILFLSSLCLQYVALLSLDGINAGLPVVALLFHHLPHTDFRYELWMLAHGGSGILKCRIYRNFSRESSRITK